VPDTLHRLKAALAHRYRLEREFLLGLSSGTGTSTGQGAFTRLLVKSPNKGD
jgi:hypothetical protein